MGNKKILLCGMALVVFFFGAYYVVSHTAEKNPTAEYVQKLFTQDSVHEIDIQIAEDAWQDMLENPLEEEFHQADVVIDGEVMGNVGIRTKGNTSLTSVANSDSDRYSFKIDFDYYDDGSYYGLKKLNLNNNYSDSTYMKEYISYEICEAMGLPTPAHSYTHITVNGEEWGLYLAVEAVDKVFVANKFQETTGDLYKPDGTGANLAYIDDDISSYSGLSLKTNESTSDGSDMLALIKALDSGEGLEDVLDVDEALRYLAVNVSIANFDSYLGGTTHNYYLYEQNGRFSVIPWDYNLAFGGFGSGTTDIYAPASSSMGGGGRRNVDGEMPWEKNTDKETVDTTEEEATEAIGQTTSQATGQAEEGQAGAPAGEGQAGEEQEGMGNQGSETSSSNKPLVTTLLANEAYLAQYEAYLAEIADSYLSEAYMAHMVTTISEQISPYVEQDATAFYTYEEFQEATSVSADDNHSLVYFAVNMAADIYNQLGGSEASFHTGSYQGSGMGGGGGGQRPNNGEGGGQRPEDAGGETNAMPQGMMPPTTQPQTEGEQMAGGFPDGDFPEGDFPREEMPEGRGGPEGHDGGFGGNENIQQEMTDEEKQTAKGKWAGTAGIFAVGFVAVFLYQRKCKLS